MSPRAILLGIALGLLVASTTYFNDFVIGQTFLIGNHLPASVFGMGLVLLLGVNPLLRLVSPNWPLRGSEIALILALGLAVCAWPGSGLLRYMGQYVVTPGHTLQIKSAWQATRVMSYLPGGSAQIAEGYITDWDALLAAMASGSDANASPPWPAVYQRLDEPARQVVDNHIAGQLLKPTQREAVLVGLNRAVSDPTFSVAALATSLAPPPSPQLASQEEVEARNREILVAALPGVIKPPPHGEGLLLNDGIMTPDIQPLLSGGVGEATRMGVVDVPWGVWWPTLRLWGGVSLFAGLAVLCLLVITHPQWFHREVLPYPTVQFVSELTRSRPGAAFPDVASNRLFWYGLGSVTFLHLLNGMHAWYPQWPYINMVLPFDPLRELFPNASQTPGSWGLFKPMIYPSVIGFGFFINTRVAFSVGISQVLWVMLGAWMISFAVPLTSNRFGIDSNGASMRFGAYAGMTLMILYFGRRHYFRTVLGAVGFRVDAQTPRSSIWAARLFAVFMALSVFTLVRWGGLGPVLATMVVGMVVMIGLVLARINAETGLFYAQPDWLPGTVLAGILGLEGIGPEALIVLTMTGVVMAGDPRENIGPYLVNGLAMGQKVGGQRPGRVSPWIGMMIVLGLVAAVLATTTLQYNHGFSFDGWGAGQADQTFNAASMAIRKLSAADELSQSTGLRGLAPFQLAQPVSAAVIWIGVGLVLLLGCAVARIRLPWWPLHPVIFLVWGSYPMAMFSFSFLLAAAVKWAVIRLGGETSYHAVKPLMVGIIAGEVLMILFWSAVGTIYWFNTGESPPLYRILPI